MGGLMLVVFLAFLCGVCVGITACLSYELDLED